MSKIDHTHEGTNTWEYIGIVPMHAYEWASYDHGVIERTMWPVCIYVYIHHTYISYQ